MSEPSRNTEGEIIEIVKAFQAGKKIQFWNEAVGNWGMLTAGNPRWDFHSIVFRVEPSTHVEYQNKYPYGSSSEAWPDRMRANRYANSDRIACVRVEWEEGQFDE